MAEFDEDMLPIERMGEFCTKEQQATVADLVSRGWIASHIMEYPMSYLNVWMVTKHYKTSLSARPWTHGYVTPTGEFKRYRSSR